MRVDPNLFNALNGGIQSTEQALNTAVQQLSSGQRVLTPADDPYAASADLRSLAASANADRYTSNGDAVLSQIQMADSALSSVISELTQAVVLGTNGANGTTNTADRASIAVQVQTILTEVVSQANQKFNGQSLFSGTSSVAASFVADSTSPDGYVYQGNSGVNNTTIGEGLQINVNIPGDQIFTSPSGNVLGALTQLVSALNGGTPTDIANATSAISRAIAHVSQLRAVYAGTVHQVQAQENYLSQETIALSTQQHSLIGIDTATAITNLTQAQTAHSAVLAAAAKVLPISLLDYLK